MIKSGMAWKRPSLSASPLICRWPGVLLGASDPISQACWSPTVSIFLSCTFPNTWICSVWPIDEHVLEHVLERQGSHFRITDLPKCYRFR